jgi:hypothetical protein
MEYPTVWILKTVDCAARELDPNLRGRKAVGLGYRKWSYFY